MFVRRVSLHRVEVPTRKNNAPALMDVIVGRFIAGCCLLLAADVAHNSYPAALICVLCDRRRGGRAGLATTPTATAPSVFTRSSRAASTDG